MFGKEFFRFGIINNVAEALMKFDKRTNLEVFVQRIQEQIEKNVKCVEINNLDVYLDKDYGWSLCADDRVPPKNIAEYKDRENIALAYKQKDHMDMAAIEFEECARELLCNCVYTTLNITNENIESMNAYLLESKKCWLEFSGKFILPSQKKHL